ncbi:hypothetical protein Agub_g15627, partial [Astrephomene gubernaculifera]
SASTAAAAAGGAAGGAAAGGGGGGAVAGGGGAAAVSGGPAAWAGSLGVEELVAVVADAEMVHQALLGPFTLSLLEVAFPQQPPATTLALVQQANQTATSTPTAAAGGLESTPTASVAAPTAEGSSSSNSALVTAAQAVLAALQEAATAVQSAGRSLAAVLTDEVVDRCVVVVRQLKGITATYRMTSKGPPSRASHYVGGVLAPLRGLLEGSAAKKMGQQEQQSLLVAPVCEGVCGRYGQLAEELLSSVRKTESSLKRLKKAKAGGGGAGGEEDPTAASLLSDSDKITLQLHLDVLDLGAHMGVLLG